MAQKPVYTYSSIGGGVGVTHYWGDLTSYDGSFQLNAPSIRPALELEYERRFLPRFTYRGHLFFHQIFADDMQNARTETEAGQYQYIRNLHFKNTLIGLSTSLRYDFLTSKDHFTERKTVMPYMHAGLSIFHHNPLAKTSGQFGGVWVPLRDLGTQGQWQTTKSPYSRVLMAIPVGLGFDYKLGDRLSLGVEARFNIALSDYLDDVSASYVDLGIFEGDSLARAMSYRGHERYGAYTQIQRSFDGFTVLPQELVYTGVDGTNYTVYDGYGQEGTSRGSDANDTYLYLGVNLKYIYSKNANPKNLSRLYNINRPSRKKTVYGRAGDAEARFGMYKDRYTVKGLTINTVHDEFSPIFYKEGLLFASNQTHKKLTLKRSRQQYLNFFFINFIDLNSSSAQSSKPIKIGDNNDFSRHHLNSATVVRLNNGSVKVIFSTNEKADNDAKLKRHQLYMADVVAEGVWKNIQALPINREDFSLSQPSISPDGKHLYFVSDRYDGMGGTDIYVTHNYDGHWTVPHNVGEPVNTPGDELYPFVHDDGLLYFSSDGHEGVGGLDIFEAFSGDNETFTEVNNLGFPVNSAQDDFGLVLNEVKRTGYFVSNRSGGVGGNDIYQLDVEVLSRSRKLTDQSKDVIKKLSFPLVGQVLDQESNQPIPHAIVKVHNLLTDEISVRRADKQGRYKFMLYNENQYELTTTSKGYLPMLKKKFSTVGVSSEEPQEMDIKLSSIKYTFDVRGTITDKFSLKSLAGAKVALIDVESHEQQEMITKSDGKYQFKLKPNRKYLVFVSENGYKHAEITISTRGKMQSEVFVYHFKLEKEAK